jgi:hypothetical protein
MTAAFPAAGPAAFPAAAFLTVVDAVAWSGRGATVTAWIR